jgi:hypothetical protein
MRHNTAVVVVRPSGEGGITPAKQVPTRYLTPIRKVFDGWQDLCGCILWLHYSAKKISNHKGTKYPDTKHGY